MVENTTEEYSVEIDQPPAYVKRIERKKTARERKEKEFLESSRKIFDDADTDKSGFLSMEQSKDLAVKMHEHHGTEYNEEEF